MSGVVYEWGEGNGVPTPADVLELLPASVMFHELPVPAAVIDADGDTLLAINPALVAVCRRSQAELLGAGFARVRQWLGVNDEGASADTHAQLVPMRFKGRSFALWFSATPDDAAPQRERDPLTGLTSKFSIELRIRELLLAGSCGVLIRFEVDQLKLINDAYGREAGNQLLKQLGALFAKLLAPDYEVAYLGGDDFAVVVPDIDVERAWQIAEGVRLQIAAQGFEWGARAYGVTTSIGIAAFEDAAKDFGELMKAADVACESAKSRGRNRIEIYHHADRELRRVRGEQSWGARVLDALEDNRFALFRQHILPLRPGVGEEHWEVLLRVRGTSGWVPPSDFVTAAERYGLMPQMDRRVISRVLRHLSGMSTEERPVMAINLSGNSLSDQGLASYISRLLEVNEVDPRHLRFEITETAAIANTVRAVALVDALRKLGCQVALDDFGAGMSSFSYLKVLDVDMIKIDGSFVRSLLTDAVDAATVESMVQIAKLRGIQTVAEWVEDHASLDRLIEIGVDYGQGFFLHKPEPWALP